ncbi:PRC-barrel domain containing protein [Gemmobacter lutimaris]|uniref:PRC-barrel domain containing protein n=1 Tax=Gemmobacter lutimaris TaxID=2306023 RepID=A0A398BNL2_9RHOB|nr:PRC-barrel domain-containing protein [Gemmobacter lutimaris]RID92105.1 PRC-barrel domain containing protein [Gemmobacter lutimaris]
MKTLLNSTILALGLTAGMAGGVLADTATTTPDPAAPQAAAPAETMATDATASPYLSTIDQGVRASDFIGKRVWLTEADTSALNPDGYAEASADWQDAGEISDVILSRSGDTEAVLVDFGGFLGIGEKTVAIDMARLTMVPDADSPQDYFIVFNGTKTDLEAAPAFDTAMIFSTEAPAGDRAEVTADPVATPVAPMATDTTTAPAAPAETMAEAPATGAADAAVMGEPVDFTGVTEADLVGKRVYGPGDEHVGEVSAVTLDGNGAVQSVVVDVGGFLGIGEKSVSLTADMLRIAPDADGDGTVLHVSATEDQLKALPEAAG